MFFKSKNHYDNEVSKKVTETAENLMVQIGTEIHDDIIQKLSIIKLHIDNINGHLGDPVELQRIVLELTTEFEHTTNSIRALSHRLMPSQIDHESLNQQIQLMCQLIEKSTKRVIHYTSHGDEPLLNSSTKLNLLRICQEIIQNSVRHSHAWNIWVRFKWDESVIEFEIEDDGTNITKLNQIISTLDFKNNSIRIRAKSIGATIQNSTGAKGLITRVKYRLLNRVSL